MCKTLPGQFGWFVCVLLALMMGNASAEVFVPAPKAVQGDACVEPTDIMRRDHMNMLKHQRDDTVLSGIRTARHSLVGCIDCHADKDGQGEYVPVNAPGQFCSACHSYAAVQMDCFQCHSTVPVDQGNTGVNDMQHRGFAHHDRFEPRWPSMMSQGLPNE